jgi:hypothetical protein
MWRLRKPPDAALCDFNTLREVIRLLEKREGPELRPVARPLAFAGSLEL